MPLGDSTGPTCADAAPAASVSDGCRRPPTWLRDDLDGAASEFLGEALETLETAYGLGESCFRLVPTGAAPGEVAVVDATPNGQHVGTYREILDRRAADPSFYTLEIAGGRFDLLAGCTRLVYQHMIEALRDEGVQFLPDSLALNQYNGHVWTATMLTGEPLPAPDLIWIASSSGGRRVNYVEHPIGRGGRSFRVRPVVVLRSGH